LRITMVDQLQVLFLAAADQANEERKENERLEGAQRAMQASDLLSALANATFLASRPLKIRDEGSSGVIPALLRAHPSSKSSQALVLRQSSTCPSGSLLCADGSGCCTIGTYCGVFGGQRGCCDIGEICGSVGNECAVAGDLPCSNGDGCCPAGQSCFVSGGTTFCDDSNGGGAVTTTRTTTTPRDTPTTVTHTTSIPVNVPTIVTTRTTSIPINVPTATTNDLNTHFTTNTPGIPPPAVPTNLGGTPTLGRSSTIVSSSPTAFSTSSGNTLTCGVSSFVLLLGGIAVNIFSTL